MFNAPFNCLLAVPIMLFYEKGVPRLITAIKNQSECVITFNNIGLAFIKIFYMIIVF